MATVVETGGLIDRDPAIRGGRPKIAGTGVSVMRVTRWYKQGMSPEEIAAHFGHITLATVHAALAYYHANPEEIETDLSAEDVLWEKVDAQLPQNSPPRVAHSDHKKLRKVFSR